MISIDTIPLWLLVALPLAGAGASLLLRSERAVLGAVAATAMVSAALDLYAVWLVYSAGPVFSTDNWFFIDALSAFHLIVFVLVFVMSSFYSLVYMKAEAASGLLSLHRTRLFGSLWCGALAAMTLVLVANNLGIMWVGLEATTLLTGFLICLHRTRESLEAMWKYILICSVGVALAFMGTLFLAASAHGLQFDSTQLLLWTTLSAHAAELDPALCKIAFVFLLVGYGTKAGLAPMHSWLPDAHSQAPTPVSALFSGFMLSAAMYCIMRCLPVVEVATGKTGWTSGPLLLLGLVSIGVAAAFILFQRDIKRLLAYSSVEHVGIMAVGLGLGGFGVFAALFHVLNHSLAKSLSFFAAGRLGQHAHTHEIKGLHGMISFSPWWGSALFAGLLALIGVAPFSIFMSEFQIVKAAMDSRSFLVLGLFSAGLAVVFVGVLSHLIPMAWDHSATAPVPRGQMTMTEKLLVLVPLLLLLLLGLWMPEPLRTLLNAASEIIRGGISSHPAGWGNMAL